MFVLKVVTLIVMCGPEGQVSELHLTKDYDAVVTLLYADVYTWYIFLQFCWIFAGFYLLPDFIE